MGWRCPQPPHETAVTAASPWQPGAQIGHNLGLGHAAAMDVNDIKSGSPLAGGCE